MRYARISDGIVREIIDVPEGIEVDEMFHADIVATLVECGEEVEEGWHHDSGDFSPPAPASESVSLDTLFAYAADRRWRAETAGTQWNGWYLPTDERSQAKYMAELQAVGLGVRDDPSPWKFQHGFEMVTDAEVQEMAVAARLHVLSCFAREGAVQAGIAAEAVNTTAAIDAAFDDVSEPWQPDAPSGD